MRAAVLRSIAVVAVGAVVLGLLLYVASTVDRRAPAVTAIALTLPLPDEPTRGFITTSIEVDFTEPLADEPADALLRIEPDIGGSVTWSGSRLIFTPAEPLEPATTYTVEVVPGARDRAGNQMTDVPPPFAFETAGPPRLVETVPADGADEVDPAAAIQLTFSTPMDTASVEAALQLRPAFPHELRWSGRLLEIAPTRPLDVDRAYAISIGDGAIDVAGLALAEPASLSFQTVAPGVAARMVVPADGTDGIAARTPIAIVFDDAIDPDAVTDEVLTIAPEVGGALEVVDERGNPPDEPSEGVVLRFTPSEPLPENTTFEVELGAGITALESEDVAEPTSWTFTTGTALPTLSNQVVFLSARSGVPNLWAMNADGSAQRQLSAELSPILDYAVAPDGTSFVVGDGRRLIAADAAGTNRRVLTDDSTLEFDPTYAPAGDRIAFARADAASGAGLGIWERPIAGGDATQVAVEPTDEDGPSASAPSADAAEGAWLRAPRYAPDGGALAFVDLRGSVGVIDLASGSVTRTPLLAAAPPAWLPDADRLLVMGLSPDGDGAPDPAYDDVVVPLDPQEVAGASAWVVERARDGRSAARFADGSIVAAVAADGRVALLGARDGLRLADGPNDGGDPVPALRGERVASATFAPGEEALAVAIGGPSGGGDQREARIERIDLDGSSRTVLVNGGWRPAWLP